MHPDVKEKLERYEKVLRAERDPETLSTTAYAGDRVLCTRRFSTEPSLAIQYAIEDLLNDEDRGDDDAFAPLEWALTEASFEECKRKHKEAAQKYNRLTAKVNAMLEFLSAHEANMKQSAEARETWRRANLAFRKLFFSDIEPHVLDVPDHQANKKGCQGD